MKISLDGLTLDVTVTPELFALAGCSDSAGIRSFLRDEAVQHVATYLQENDITVRAIIDNRGEQTWHADCGG